MSPVAIKAEGISKQYHIGMLRTKNMTLQEQITEALALPFRRLGGLMRGRASAASDLEETFWALQDVSFTIDQGERVAVIGSNGAGKSTLLKILSRVTEPTRGTAFIRGRIGSLLEVGTGFHSQLTGRENVFLNGSILGMRQEEVIRKFDEIVAFSEVEQFIDTPVKFYSSGMQVRLAFSVAAHLEPHVLIVDEVLSVGDVAFRKKCMDRMHEVAAQGTTILVVSHHAQTVQSMCDRAIWLQKGQVVRDGPAFETLSEYLGNNMGLLAERVWDAESAPGGEIARVRAMRIVTESGECRDHVDVRERFCIETDVEVLVPGHGIVFKNEFYNGDGTQVFASLDADNPIWTRKTTWPPGHYRLRMWVPANFLQIDSYSIAANLWAWEPAQIHQGWQRHVLSFHVIDSFDGSTARGRFEGNLSGVVRPRLEWDMEPRISSAETDVAATHTLRPTAHASPGGR